MPRVLCLCLSLALAGCGAARKPKAHYTVVVERPCIERIELTDKTECAGDDQSTLHCTDLRLTYRPDCAKTQVTK